MKTIIVSAVALLTIAYAGANFINYTENSNQLAQVTIPVLGGKGSVELDLFGQKINVDLSKLLFQDDPAPTPGSCDACKKAVSAVSLDEQALKALLLKYENDASFACAPFHPNKVQKAECKRLTDIYKDKAKQLNRLDNEQKAAEKRCQKICLNVPTLIVTCRYSPSIPKEPTIGTPVTFFSSVTGGIEAKTYSWKEDGKDFDSKAKTDRTWPTKGLKKITVTVVSGGQTKTASCPVTIKNPQPVITTPPVTPPLTPPTVPTTPPTIPTTPTTPPVTTGFPVSKTFTVSCYSRCIPYGNCYTGEVSWEAAPQGWVYPSTIIYEWSEGGVPFAGNYYIGGKSGATKYTTGGHHEVTIKITSNGEFATNKCSIDLPYTLAN